MHLFLIRHPQPEVGQGICYGQTDLALAAQPHVLAGRLRAALPPGIPVYSSPLRRCRELACELHDQPLLDERLMEMHFGDWEMQPWASIPRAQLDAWVAAPLTYRPHQGETVAEVQARVLAFLHEKQAQHETLALVTHAGVMKILHGLHGCLPLAVWMPMTFAYGELVCLQWET